MQTMSVLPVCNLKDLHVLYHSTRAGGCVIKSCESSPKRTLQRVLTWTLEPDPIYQMDEVLCERRLASQQQLQWRCSETSSLQISVLRQGSCIRWSQEHGTQLSI
jgi:hypothetical protein